MRTVALALACSAAVACGGAQSAASTSSASDDRACAPYVAKWRAIIAPNAIVTVYSDDGAPGYVNEALIQVSPSLALTEIFIRPPEPMESDVVASKSCKVRALDRAALDAFQSELVDHHFCDIKLGEHDPDITVYRITVHLPRVDCEADVPGLEEQQTSDGKAALAAVERLRAIAR